MDQIKSSENQNEINQQEVDFNVKSEGAATTEPQRKIAVNTPEQKSRVHYNPSEAPSFDPVFDEVRTPQDKAEIDRLDRMIETGSARGVSMPAERPFWFRVSQTLGVLGSAAWAIICVAYFALEGGIATQTPYELGVFIAGMIAPIALYWMLLSYLQRNSDVQYYAENLRAELHTLFFPSEEDSRRVNKDIERMTSQAAELATSSKVALKAIHQTRLGLRNEIKEFAELARKTESHLISLSDGMNEKTQSMGLLMSDIEKRVSAIEEKAQNSARTLESAGEALTAKAEKMESAMEKGADRILSMAEVAEEKSGAVSHMFDNTITSLGLTVDAVIDRLGGMNTEFATYTKSLQTSAEDLSKETIRLGSMIDDQIDQLKNATGQSVELVSESMNSIMEQKEAIDDSANLLTAQAERIAGTIMQSVTSLTNATSDIIDQSAAIETRLSDKSASIAETLNTFSAEIDRIDGLSDMASHRLSESIETAVHGAEQVSDAIRRGADTLIQTSREATLEAKAVIEDSITHVQNMKEVGQGNVRSIEAMVELLEKARTQIEKSSQAAKSHVDVLSSAVETQGDKLETTAQSLADQVNMISRTLEDPLRQIGIAVAEADGRHEQIQETLDRRVKDLREASTRAGETVEIIRSALREQTQDIATLSNKVLSQSKSLNDELVNNKAAMTITIDTGLKDMGRLMTGMVQTHDHIRTLSHDLMDQLTANDINIEIAANRLNDTATISIQALSLASESVAEESKSLELRIDMANDKVTETSDRLQRVSEQILPIYEQVEAGSTRAVESLNEFKDNYVELSETTLGKIEAATLQFDDRLIKLQAGSNEAASLLKSTSETLRQRLDDIEASAEGAQMKMKSLSSAMEGQSSDIHILTDQATLKIETIQKLVNEQFTTLDNAIAEGVQKIEAAGQKFDERAGQLTVNMTEVTAGFTEAGDEAYAKAYQLKQAAQNIADVSQNSVSRIASQMDVLQQKSDGSLGALRKTSDTLSIKSKEIDTMMQSVLKQAKAYATDMREQVAAVADQSDQSVHHIGQSISQLLGTMDQVNGKTKSVVNFIQETNSSLYDQSGKFVTAVAKSAQAAEHATELFSQQTDHLLKASRVALEKADHIRQTELRASRETFLSSAKFVLESLHSLSIDFVRMIDGEVSEKDWRAYQKGDVALFTSKLAARLESIPSDRIRNKYAEDTEFRTYVQKFMRQFEDILDQTDTVDRGAILGTVFASSDIGKIHRFLNNVTGRGEARNGGNGNSIAA